MFGLPRSGSATRATAPHDMFDYNPAVSPLSGVRAGQSAMRRGVARAHRVRRRRLPLAAETARFPALSNGSRGGVDWARVSVTGVPAALIFLLALASCGGGGGGAGGGAVVPGAGVARNARDDVIKHVVIIAAREPLVRQPVPRLSGRGHGVAGAHPTVDRSRSNPCRWRTAYDSEPQLRAISRRAFDGGKMDGFDLVPRVPGQREEPRVLVRAARRSAALLRPGVVVRARRPHVPVEQQRQLRRAPVPDRRAERERRDNPVTPCRGAATRRRHRPSRCGSQRRSA